MMSRRREAFWYRVSEKLGIEIAVLGVGSWQFLPGQIGTSVAFETNDGETASWMKRAIDHRRETPWWFHTHPDMPAFFSSTDVRGAHALWDMVRRPFTAVVAGNGGKRWEKVIDAAWLKRHPEPPPPPKVTRVPLPYVPYRSQQSNFWCGWCGGFDGYHSETCTRPLARSVISDAPLSLLPARVFRPEANLRLELDQLMQKFGETEVYEAIDMMITEKYADRRIAERLEEETWNG